ncbi:virB8 family protein [Phenylobacterium deserti]|uniref:VirB8 family protein n=1 Tax=Phenylobacterium deserti TaxID=1914756 RepID=A0A328ADQ4_9CAUL|nr:VirB8/TrbF family protein [Phenylobacterium deserti]RAK52771.1 virB8 family protein [Phenylobacterium deserti]
MAPVTPSGLQAYLAEAESWDHDRWRAAERSRRRAWAAAAGAAGLAGCCALALAALAPLKTVEPYVVRVDRTSGAVEVLTGLSGRRDMPVEEAVTKSFLATYVRARESWLAPAAEANFRQVAVMSAPAEQQRWAEAFRPSNPASPQVALGPDAEAEVQLRAISLAAPGVATVRFRRTLRRGGQVETGDWLATISFAYVRAPLREADRLRNPLGFQVTRYRTDPEVTP